MLVKNVLLYKVTMVNTFMAVTTFRLIIITLRKLAIQIQKLPIDLIIHCRSIKDKEGNALLLAD